MTWGPVWVRVTSVGREVKNEISGAGRERSRAGKLPLMCLEFEAGWVPSPGLQVKFEIRLNAPECTFSAFHMAHPYRARPAFLRFPGPPLGRGRVFSREAARGPGAGRRKEEDGEHASLAGWLARSDGRYSTGGQFRSVIVRRDNGPSLAETCRRRH